MKIIIDGEGGHFCRACLMIDDNNYGASEIGSTIEEAIGLLVGLHPEQFGCKIEIFPCSTTAYNRSGIPPITRK